MGGNINTQAGRGEGEEKNWEESWTEIAVCEEGGDEEIRSYVSGKRDPEGKGESEKSAKRRKVHVGVGA